MSQDPDESTFNETTPLLSPQEDLYDHLLFTGKTLPSVFLGLLLTLLQTISYGILIFPPNNPNLPPSVASAGISIFLFSSLIAQIVFALKSEFVGVSGLMMLEVIPFLHLICKTVESNTADGKRVLPTIVLVYALSTITTGVLFLLLGLFKLGRVVAYFPRHVLLGCIGGLIYIHAGIGVFLLQSGFEITSGIKDWNSLLETPRVFQWSLSIGLTVILKLLQLTIKHPLFVPLYYSFIPVLFYGSVWISRVDLSVIRNDGWLFHLNASNEPFYTYWTFFDFQVSFEALVACIPSMIALAFFGMFPLIKGVLHVPINCPALSVSTGQTVDMNNEIILHGISNIISGCLGACQNYLVYFNPLSPVILIQFSYINVVVTQGQVESY